MDKLQDLVKKINEDKYPTLETIMNTIITSKVIKNGIFVVDFPGEKIRSVMVHDINYKKENEYDLIVAKKVEFWNIEIPEESKKKEFFERIQNIIPEE